MKKAISVLSVIMLLTMPFGIATMVDADEGEVYIADSNMSECYTSSDSVSISNIDVYASTSVGVWNCQWDSFMGAWKYGYKIGGMASSEGDEVIRLAHVRLEGTGEADGLILDDINHSEHTWSAPRSNASSYDGVKDVSNLLINLGLIALNNAGASLAWTLVSAVISAMGSGDDDSTSEDNYKTHTWEWSPDIDETCQQVGAYACVDSGLTRSFEVEYTIIGPTFEILSPGVFTFTMTAPDTNGVSPADMTPLQRESLGIITVDRDNLVSRASELNLSEDDLTSMITSQESEFYFADSQPTCSIRESEVDLQEFLDMNGFTEDPEHYLSQVDESSEGCADDLVVTGQGTSEEFSPIVVPVIGDVPGIDCDVGIRTEGSRITIDPMSVSGSSIGLDSSRQHPYHNHGMNVMMAHSEVGS